MVLFECVGFKFLRVGILYATWIVLASDFIGKIILIQ